MSKIQVNEVVNHFDNGAPDFPRGVTVTGVSTFSGAVSVGGTLTYEDVTSIDSVGIITAQSGIKVLAGGATITGNVGLGSQSPVSPLDVNGTVSVKGRYVMTISDPDMLNVGGVTASSALGISTVRLFTNDNARLTIGSDGTSTFDVGAPSSSNKVIGRFQAESVRALDIVWHDSGSLMGFNTPGNHSYIFKCNDNVRLRISSDGQVTKPSNAAFRAQGNTQYPNITTGSIDLVYDNEIFDAGSNFDPSTGRFTAPVDGKYFFYFQYLTYPDADPAYKTMNFKVNGTSSYNNGFFRTKSVSQESSALIALLDLSASDWVIPHVVWASGTYDFYMISGHAHFFGYLVS